MLPGLRITILSSALRNLAILVTPPVRCDKQYIQTVSLEPSKLLFLNLLQEVWLFQEEQGYLTGRETAISKLKLETGHLSAYIKNMVCLNH